MMIVANIATLPAILISTSVPSKIGLLSKKLTIILTNR
nr:MAG TPA: hypothetical protein [Caudoviricetes sp.]DAW52091.1 MAG TPA: hypothetical protein [Caudoviricetes sp.]